MQTKYKAIVEQQQDRLYAIALHVLQDRVAAEDVCQEAFVRLWKSIEQVEIASAGAWLKTVVRNLCIDAIRRRRDTDSFAEEDVACADTAGKPLQSAQQQQRRGALHVAISGLKEPYRSLVVKADLQQQSIADIAASSCLNSNQVKVYLHRARKQLREQLAGAEW